MANQISHLTEMGLFLLILHMDNVRPIPKKIIIIQMKERDHSLRIRAQP